MKRGFLLLAALAAVVFSLSLALRRFDGLSAPAVAPSAVTPVGGLILDAGHGGEDGGAVSVTGAPESQINLAVVLKIDALLGLYGQSPLLLRDEDKAIYDEGCVTLHEKKVSDLKNRAAIIQSCPGATLLSIHQNSYPQAKYRGTQVFFSPTEGSRELAEHVRETVQGALQPENKREVKQIPDTVYLMNHIDCPAVLVECGFLSNPEEEALLRDEGYQKKLAATLAAAWLTAPKEEVPPA